MFAADTVISDEVFQKGPITLKEGFDSEGVKTYYTAKHNLYMSFCEAMSLVARVFDSSPFFLKDDISWLREYLSVFVNCYSYLDKKHFPKLSVETVYENVFGTKNGTEIEIASRYALEATRLYYLLDVIDAVLYGGSIGDFKVSRKKPSFIQTARISAMMDEGEAWGFGRNFAAQMRESSFRHYEADRCFSGYVVVFQDDALDQYDFLKPLKVEHCYSAEIYTFYKSTDYQRDSKYYKLLPLSRSHHPCLVNRLSTYPFITVQMNVRDYPNNLLGCRICLPFYSFIGGMPGQVNKMVAAVNNFENLTSDCVLELSLHNHIKFESDNMARLYGLAPRF